MTSRLGVFTDYATLIRYQITLGSCLVITPRIVCAIICIARSTSKQNNDAGVQLQDHKSATWPGGCYNQWFSADLKLDWISATIDSQFSSGYGRFLGLAYWVIPT